MSAKSKKTSKKPAAKKSVGKKPAEKKKKLALVKKTAKPAKAAKRKPVKATKKIAAKKASAKSKAKAKTKVKKVPVSKKALNKSAKVKAKPKPKVKPAKAKVKPKAKPPAAKPAPAPKKPAGKPLPQGAMPRVALLSHIGMPPILARPVHTVRPIAPPAINPALANNWKTKSAAELSDDEVLAMPMSEYMNEKQREFFRRRLEQLRSEILSSAGETTGHLREDTSIVPDPADRATIEEEHALELRTRDRERKLLKKIEQAMERLESGEYGFCEETGEEIGIARLLARPTATLSLAAQEQREMRQRMYGETLANAAAPPL